MTWLEKTCTGYLILDSKPEWVTSQPQSSEMVEVKPACGTLLQLVIQVDGNIIAWFIRILWFSV